MTKILKRSPHYGQPVAPGAKGFFDFAGWEMPEPFTSRDDEVKACRSAAVLFDGHQMGEIPLKGPDAQDAVTLLPAAVERRPARVLIHS